MNYKHDISNTILKTNRLTLRPFVLSDLDDLYEYAKVDGVGQMAGWPPHKNKEESLMILNMFIEEKKTFAIVYENKVIGSIGLENYPEELFKNIKDLNGTELGYVLSKDYWGKGLMPEACKEVLRYCFENLKLDFVACCYFAWNNQSKRVQEKLGFKYQFETIRKTRTEKEENCAYNLLMKEDYYQLPREN